MLHLEGNLENNEIYVECVTWAKATVHSLIGHLKELNNCIESVDTVLIRAFKFLMLYRR